MHSIRFIRWSICNSLGKIMKHIICFTAHVELVHIKNLLSHRKIYIHIFEHGIWQSLFKIKFSKVNEIMYTTNKFNSFQKYPVFLKTYNVFDNSNICLTSPLAYLKFQVSRPCRSEDIVIPKVCFGSNVLTNKLTYPNQKFRVSSLA